LVKSKETGASMGFCFLMFADVENATKLVHDAYVNPVSINGKYLSITYSHPNSFVPVYGSSEWISYSYLDTEYNLVEISYWDELYYAKEYPKSPPIDPLLIKGKWVPPEVLKAQEALVSEDASLAENEGSTTVTKDPVIYDQQKKNDSNDLEQESSPNLHVTKKKKIINPKDKTSVQILKWQERQEELAQPLDDETIDMSDESLKKVKHLIFLTL
jgi:hypothetical protein